MREGTAGEAEALSESAGSKPASTRPKRQALVLLVFRVALLSSDTSQQSRAGDQGRGPVHHFAQPVQCCLEPHSRERGQMGMGKRECKIPGLPTQQPDTHSGEGGQERGGLSLPLPLSLLTRHSAAQPNAPSGPRSPLWLHRAPASTCIV